MATTAISAATANDLTFMAALQIFSLKIFLPRLT
jgi:hypothetical protein